MSQENKENDNLFTDNKGVKWSITKPSESGEKPFATNSSDTGKRVKWIGGKATSEECGTIKVYGTTWNDTPMGGNLFNDELQLVKAEKNYTNALSYKSWGDVMNEETQELTNCEIIKNMLGRKREECSDDEIKLNLRDFYFTWKPPQKKATLNKKQLFDYDQPQGALLFHLVPELWKAPWVKKAEASQGSTEGGRKRKRRRKTKRKMKRKSKRKMKRKTKRKTKRRRKRRRR